MLDHLMARSGPATMIVSISPQSTALSKILRHANGANTVFYSFGVATVEARPNVRDKLKPPGVMFNDG